MNRRRWRLFALNVTLALVLVAVAVFVYRSFVGGDPASSLSGIRSTRVATGTVLATVSASGMVVSPRTLGVTFVTGGTVTEVRVKPGTHVTKGQVLAKVDPTSAQAQLETAQANLLAAEASLASVESANASSVTGSSASTESQTADLRMAEAQVTADRVAVEDAQAAVAGTVMRAPMTGTVTSVDGIVGQTVASGGGTSLVSSSSSTSDASPFVEVTDLAHLRVSANFSETDASKLKVGQGTRVTLEAATDRQLAAKVVSIDLTPTTVNNVVDYGITVAFTGKPSGVRLGETAQVQVVTGRVDNALYVPSAAVETAGGISTVTVVQNGRQVARTVQIGLQGDQTTQIVSGLAAGDVVVIPTGTGTNGFPNGNFPGGGIGGGGPITKVNGGGP